MSRNEIPLLVVRVRELQRIAWRSGRPAARKVERSIWRSFIAGSGGLLRAGDVLGHARDSEDFLAALVSRARTAAGGARAADCRAALQRLGSAIARDGAFEVESGWTMLDAASGIQELQCAVERALANGARERERYAFFSNVGHELRTPLSAVRGYVETLLDERLEAATARRYLETARAETLRMSRLVDGMFDISLLDLQLSPVAARAALADAAAAAVATVAPLARARGASLLVAGCDGIEVGLESDAVIGILVNLLENALKYGRECGAVEVRAARRASHVELCVDDDGPGVAPEERESIFALGRRGPGTLARGSGLGLAFVRLVLERRGGSAEADVSPLGGARFRLCLPLPSG